MSSYRVCIVHEGPAEVQLDFIRAHVERLPCDTILLHGFVPSVDGEALLSHRLTARIYRKLARIALSRPWSYDLTTAYRRALRRFRPSAVLAEWGPVAVRVMDACRLENIPLVAHFHGYDASVAGVLSQHAESYKQLFSNAAAIVVVSQDMCKRLMALGAPASKVYYNPYGVDLTSFAPLEGPKELVFVAVGRFVEKKAPQLSLLAFARARHVVPGIRLVMIGDGPLQGACKAIASALQIADAVTFAGAGTRADIVRALGTARAFVQHSVVASDGDAEGLPNVVLEAGAAALPVISTRHAGIPDVVIDGETGLLCDEFDIDRMSEHMVRLAQNAALAMEMGQAARRRIAAFFSVERSISGLWSIIQHAVEPAKQYDTRQGRQHTAS